MGISLGQLPPAELARLKAELAETLVANFCYPRFFDYRTESLRMRPVDRAKRQEVWLYLSSVDFTAWSRVDLMSPDFQRYIERLLIQFVQRNRSFFGEQGRKRMSDIRMLIGASATSVVQGLRAHLTGQRQERPLPFGSPRPVVSWSAPVVTGQPDPAWEQIAATTTLLQQQLQELRGEIKPVAPGEARPVNGTSRRVTRLQSPGTNTTQLDQTAPATQQSSTIVSKPVSRVPPVSDKPAAQVNTATATTAAPSPTGLKGTAPLRPASVASSPASPSSTAASVASPTSTPTPASVRKSELAAPQESPVASVPVVPGATAASGVSVPPKVAESVPPVLSPSPVQIPPAVSIAASVVPSTPPASVQARSLPQSVPPAVALSPSAAVPNVMGGQRDNPVMRVGEDDVAIFEQMRHQLLVWLRIEAIHAGIETTGQGTLQLLELLRQQAHVDETRLQVVSTLLNLANQVTKSGQVSVLDYKQALMFHLMHTRR
jgi:hypothetical protein